MTNDSQCAKILRTLATGQTLTTWLAFERFGCTTLSQRVTELKEQRWPIKSRMVTRGKSRVAEYFIPEAQAALVRKALS